MYLVCLTSHIPEHCPSDRYLQGPVLSVHHDLDEAKSAADAERWGPCGVELLHGAEVFHLNPTTLERRFVHGTALHDCPPCDAYFAGDYPFEVCEALHNDIKVHGSWRPTAPHGEWQPSGWQPFWTAPDRDERVARLLRAHGVTRVANDR